MIIGDFKKRVHVGRFEIRVKKEKPHKGKKLVGAK